MRDSKSLGHLLIQCVVLEFLSGSTLKLLNLRWAIGGSILAKLKAKGGIERQRVPWPFTSSVHCAGVLVRFNPQVS